MKYSLRLVIIISLLLISTCLHAGRYIYNNFSRGGAIDNNSIVVEDDRWYDLIGDVTWPTRFKNEKVDNLVRFKYTGQSRDYFSTGWTYKVSFRARGYTENNVLVQVNGGLPIELELSYDPTAVANYVDEAVYHFEDLHHVEVYGVSITQTFGTTLPNVPKDLYLEAEIQVERYYQLDQDATTTISHSVVTANDQDWNVSVSGKRELNLFWEVVEGAEAYDLEWCFVSQYSQASYASDGSDIDPRRFTRVTVADNRYNLNLVYEEGKIYYRVRPVGVWWNNLAQRKEGAWSYGTSSYTIIEAEAHERDKNWTYQAGYAEDGKRKEAVSYFDGSSRTRQSVTQMNTEAEAIVGEVFYDFEGRAVIQTLPTPDPLRDGSLRYYHNLTLNNNGSPTALKKIDYALDNPLAVCTVTGIQMSNQSGASNYYSSENANQDGYNAYIPDAQLYPYSQTVYGQDGRVKSQSGPGADHTMGSGHETNYFYGRPLQTDLDKLFGNEVGYAKHYTVTAVEDANGQVSVSYSDLSGRTIATSLIGDNPTGMDELASAALSETSVVDDLIGYNGYDASNESYFLTTNYLAKSEGIHHFEYVVTPETFAGLCSSPTYDCVYDVIITIYDQCGEQLQEDDYNPSTPILSQVHTVLVGTPATQTISFDVNIPAIGTYKIEKKLTLNQAAYDAALTSYEAHLRSESNTCFDDLATLITSMEAGVDWSGCESCEEYCNDPANNCPANYCANLATEDPISNAENCASILEDLIADMSPEGQYFDNQPVVNTTAPNDDWFDQFIITYASSYSVNFFTASGLSALSPSITTWQLLRDNWNPTWATALPTPVTINSIVYTGLVNFHPEYCHAGWCSLAAETTDYNHSLSLTTTMASAYTAGYFPSATDPGANATVTAILTADAGLTTPSVYNSTESTLSSMLSGSVTNLWNDARTMAAAMYTTPTDDQKWNIFKGLYINKKNELLRALENTSCAYLCDNADPATGVYPDGINETCAGSSNWTGFYIRYNNVQSTVVDNDLDDPTSAEDFVEEGLTYADNFICPQTVTIDIANIIGTLCSGSPGSYKAFYRTPGLVKTDVTSWFNYTCTVSPSNAEDFAIACRTAILAGSSNLQVNRVGSVLTIISTNASLSGYDFGFTVASNPNDLDRTFKNKFARDCVEETTCFCTELNAIYNAIDLDNPEMSDADIKTAISESFLLHYGITVSTTLIGNWLTDCADGLLSSEQLTGIQTNYPEVLVNCTPQEYDPCQTENVNSLINFYATQQYERLINAYLDEFKTAYKAHCFNLNQTSNFEEHFTMTAPTKEHHYTLFYYDQAGNLTRTVPPVGVVLLTGTDLAKVTSYRANPITNAADYTIAAHTMVTRYWYNTYNQLTAQNTPDGGLTKFWYDNVGRIVASQDAQQLAQSPDRYSYIKYDGQGRAIEAGVLTAAADPTPTQISDPTFPDNWNTLSNGTSLYTEEVTRTDYDAVVSTTNPFTLQESLYNRSRVAAVYYLERTDLPYQFASFYSYDIHGNVAKLINENTFLATIDHQFKTTDYQYDLISGNVNQVTFQKDQLDQFIHRYRYDADNRLIDVLTSRDGRIWDKDANYRYYEHGPLARVELGNQKVQGLDYAYTLQGWLKGVNGNQINANTDMGKDGSITGSYSAGNPRQHNAVARDAFGFTLGYYAGDYAAISASGNDFLNNINSPSGGTLSTAGLGNELFNGNIRHMATAIMNITETALTNNVSVYRYDQLNRIKNVETNLGTNFNAMTNTGAYHAEYTFDGNGNLQTLKRNDDDGVLMDNFTYHYQSALTNNKLDKVIDGVTTTGALDYGDIQHGQGTNNYTYDAKGQLIADAQENISEIKWYQSGKVKSIKKSSATGSEVRFFYDPMGNRILKIEQPRLAGVPSNQEKWKFTYYALDASGNTMATYSLSYENLVGGDPNEFTETFTLNDHTIYGASRLGVVQHNEVLNTRNIEVVSYTGKAFNVVTELSNTPATIDELTFNVRELGKKSYELANHLGNVLAVITDQKIAVDDHQYVSGAGNYDKYVENGIEYYYEVATGTGAFTINSASGDEIVDYYLPNVVLFSDYYPYGMQLINRHGSENSRKYRYGFNGMEKDDEVKGSGNSYTTEFRQYDPRLGRWLTLDPLAAQAPGWTPYRAFFNNPIVNIDPSGLFETRKDAKQYKKDNNLKGSIRKDTDGLFSINDKKAGTSTFYDPHFNKVSTGFLANVQTKNNKFNTSEGVVSVKTYDFESDEEHPYISTQLTFNPKNGEISQYKWVQTISTNDPVQGNFTYRSEPGVLIERTDISDRHEKSSSISYTEEGMIISDMLGRFTNSNYDVFWQAQTSLIKVNKNGDIEKRIITLTWGFVIPKNNGLDAYKLKLKEESNPSDFHMEILNTNPDLKGEDITRIVK